MNIQSLDQLLKYMPFWQLNYTIDISLKNNYIYLGNPKVASTIIKRTLFSIETAGTGITNKEDHPSPLHSPMIKPYQLQEKYLLDLLNDNDVFKFSVVRNPYARVLSAYLNKILNDKPEKENIKQLIDRRGVNDQLISFEEFVDAICKEDPYKMEQHWRPQSHQLMYPEIQYTYIGKLEDINSSFNIIDKHLKGHFLKHLSNVSYGHTNAKDKLIEYYNNDTLEKVHDKYKEDFQNFEYKEYIE